MNKLNFLSKSFIGIIFFIFLFILGKQALITLKIINFDKSDNWQIVEASNDKILDKIKTVQVGLENRVNNYFPLYNNINDLYFKSIMKLDSLYLNDIYLKNNRDDEKIFYNKNNFYYIVNNYSNSELNERLNKQVDYYNYIADTYNVNLALYLPLRYEINSFSNINNIYNNYIEFCNSLNRKIKVGALESKKESDYFNYFYRSDHHYNAEGALKAYKDIKGLYNIVDLNKYTTKEVLHNYFGSAAKSLLTDKVSDTLTVIDYPNNLSVNIKDKKFKPLELNKKDNKYYDYYVSYFDGQYDEVIYTNENIDTENNLLIISDSLAWQIDYLLANNFNKTYVVNLRYGKWLNENLDLKTYIKNNKITHVLFLQEAEEIMFDIYNFKINERVR